MANRARSAACYGSDTASTSSSKVDITGQNIRLAGTNLPLPRWIGRRMAGISEPNAGVANRAVYSRRSSSNNALYTARKPTRLLRMEEQFDAVLYVGPKSSITYSSLPPELCRDRVYTKMREARMELFSPPGSAGSNPFKKKCEDVVSHGWSPPSECISVRVVGYARKCHCWLPHKAQFPENSVTSK